MAPRGLGLVLPIVLAVVVIASCAAPDTVAVACTPGRQIACACGGGIEGYQTCRDDGSGYGACIACGDAGTSSRTDSAAPGVDAATITDAIRDARDVGNDRGGTDAGPVDTGAPDRGAPDSGTTVVTDTGVPSFAWVWIDRGGPPLQPHACRPGAGVVDGMLVDPAAFFSALVAGRDANDWERVMNDVEPSLWACGVGQQRGSAGNVRGRLFLPTGSCPDASPPAGDATAMRLGVRQESNCWSHPVDVVASP